MAICNLALYYRQLEAAALQGTKENFFGSLERKLLKCKIKLQEHLSHPELHAQVTMDSGSENSGSLLPRVTTAGGRTAGRAMFAQASNVFLSPLDTQKKNLLRGLSQTSIWDHGRKAGGIGEYSGHSAEVHTLPFHQLAWSEVGSAAKWALVWNKQGLSSTGLVPEKSGANPLGPLFLEVARSAGGAGSCWILLASQQGGW